ncbi:MAG: hypothetical protein EOO44_10335 [Flavobacterium sp.]|nr:MAG: hypothetical protein EOO44_10335 [Flavobacterium sp.]
MPNKSETHYSFSITKLNLRFMRRLIVILFLIIFTACVGQGSKKNFSFKKINKSKIVTIPVLNQVSKIKFVDLVSYLPKNYLKDGSVDYSNYIQKGINENDNVAMPDFPVLIGGTGLTLKSNSVLYFKSKSKLILEKNSLTNYEILKIHNTKNVTIYNPKLSGDRQKHTGTKGEWGMGISIKSSENINIFNPIIENCWGDAIYIGNDKTAPEDINISGGLLNNNRRNGISIVSGTKINVSDIAISNTNGTLPMSGIDIEPNNNNNTLEDINLKNVYTFNNAENGIAVILIYLIGEKEKNVSININSHVDEDSKRGFLMGGNKLEYSENIKPLKGAVYVNNPTWKNNATTLLLSSDFKYIPKYIYKNVKVMTNNKIDSRKSDETKSMARKRNIQID